MKTDTNGKTNNGSLLRWILAMILPFVFMLVILLIGLVLANSPIPTPWHDPESGQDGLTLLGSAFFAGCIFSASAHALAPRNKNTMVVILASVWIAYVVYGMFTAYELVGKFGMLRHAVGMAGIVVAMVSLWRKPKQ